jgi:hypothetical protein
MIASVDRTVEAGIAWGADNDAFAPGGFDETRWLKMLDKLAGKPGGLFCTVPDVVGDPLATRALFERYAHEVRDRGLPVGYVLQDRAGELLNNGGTMPELAEVDAYFLGGSTEYKLAAMMDWAYHCRRWGKHFHVGRVNTAKRLKKAMNCGVGTVDGSGFARCPEKNIPAALPYLEAVA